MMREKMILNRRTNIYLAKKVKYADRIWTRMLGLIGKKELAVDNALSIYPCQQIHTYFMRFPIDCIFIDKEHRVVDLLENVEPWRISRKVPASFGVIELPAGVIRKSDTRLYDTLEIIKGEKCE
jgi:uncharacterized membrane protein (UPF0127 family)